jgi:penicillin-binding protein 2
MASPRQFKVSSFANAPVRYVGVENRIQLMALVMTLAFGILCVQFWRLQVMNLSHFREMAEDNRVQTARISADRGVIYGRNDVILADNRASADIILVPGECPKERRVEVCETLESLIGVSSEGLLQQCHTYRRSPFFQIVVKADVAKFERVRVEEHAYQLPGVSIVAHSRRRYVYGRTGGQLLGSLGEIGEKELRQWKGYHIRDMIGRRGAEFMYEDLLHGQDGFVHVTQYASGRPQMRTDRLGKPYFAHRDSEGNLIEEAYREDPVSGQALYLTVDIGLQAKCEELLLGKVGAIVVLDSDTGAVLSMASSPGYNPNIFVNRDPNNERGKLLSAESNPMLNRAYRENYAPGSVFKIALAAAALEEDIIDEHTTFFCPGSFRLPNVSRPWYCWKRGGHGKVSIEEALAYSCDVFFYNVGRELSLIDETMGVDKIAQWAQQFGLGIKTGIDLPQEITGLIPTKAWKWEFNSDKERSERSWYPGETINLSIGQGSATTTPLQNAVMMAVIANGGRRVRPYLRRDRGPELSEKFLRSESVEIITRGMQMCVEKDAPPPTGTGKSAHVPGFVILGKTGTAQVASLSVRQKYDENDEDIPYRLRHHAWFVAGVLNREPRIALCILVEHGDSASNVAAPLAREIITSFYDADALRVASKGTAS